MDSGNSSSMQSSSGGGGGGDQEEYNSRADQSISALFNNNNHATTAGPTQLDSLIANYINTGWSTDNPLWSTTTTPPILITNPLEQDQRVVSNTNTNTNTNTSSPISCVPTDKKNCLAATTTRIPKKRSRVSRRAPTTVMTTDTSNFRAMVQEFTGNPSNPFTGLSSSFPRSSRFDLFGPSSSSRPLKPFPHKIISPPSTDYHQSLGHNMNMQNPFLNNQGLRTSNGFGHVDVGTHQLQNIIASSSSSSMVQTTLNTMHGLEKNSKTNYDPVRSINGEEQYMVQRSDGYTPQ